MKETPFVSIIVPVYKAEQCLAHCVESILRQSFNDWELLLIDDGSPDHSGALCDEYARKDERVKAFHKENGGVSSARNLGLENAQGEYVTFIDADDYVSEDYIEKMAACAPADLIICGFTNEGETIFKPDAVKNEDLNNNPFLYTLFEVPYYLDTPWCKLFRNEILRHNKLSFDRKLKLSEDTLFCYDYVSKIRSISVISDALYTYDGKWGGGSKYQLTWEELSYMAERITLAIKRVNNTFSVCVDDGYKGFHASKLINIFSEYKDYQLYNLYLKYYSKISIGEFLGDSRSPLASGFTQLSEFAQKGQLNDCLKLLNNIKMFTTTPAHRITFCSRKNKVLFYSMRVFGVSITVRLLTLISK